ncbi:hypothetical protein [Ramlibacter sp.]|uniref:hypothetical protein n=1 Tax=Ramlibacter sp. TaxID=1917967 RepID=UPI002FC72BC9
MVRRFKSDASQMRAAYMSSLLVALFQAMVRGVNALRASASQPALPMGQRRIAASSWGKL